MPPEVRPAPLRAPMQASLACASCTPPSLPATRPRCPREAGRSPAAPGRPARCGPGPPRSPRRATGGWLFAPRAGPACVDANSLRRVWRLNFEFRAVARRTSSCTRMLSRSSGPRAVPRPRPAIPRPRPAIPQLLPRLGCGQHSPTVRRAPAAVRRAPAPGCPSGRLRWDSGRRDRRALFTGRIVKDVQPLNNDALRLNFSPFVDFSEPPSLLITARLDGSRGGRGDVCPARFGFPAAAPTRRPWGPARGLPPSQAGTKTKP